MQKIYSARARLDISDYAYFKRWGRTLGLLTHHSTALQLPNVVAMSGQQHPFFAPDQDVQPAQSAGFLDGINSGKFQDGTTPICPGLLQVCCLGLLVRPFEVYSRPCV